MKFGEPAMPTPEELAKIEKERALSDAELLKGGAEYKFDEKGEKKLDITNEQVKDARREMEEEIKRLEKEAEEVANEAINISKEIEQISKDREKQIEKGSVSWEYREKLMGKLNVVQDSWRGVKDRAMVLVGSTLLLNSASWIALGFSGVSGREWTEAGAVMMAAVAAVNTAGYVISAMIHGYKETKAQDDLDEIKGKVKMPY